MNRSTFVLHTRLSLLLLFCLEGFIGLSQPPRGNSYEQFQNMATYASNNNDYYNEIAYLKEAYTFKPLDSLAKKISLLYEKIRDYEEAKKWIDVYTRNPKYQNPQDLILLGRVQKILGQTDEATATFTRVQEKSENPDVKKIATRELDGMKPQNVASSDRTYSSSPLTAINSLYGETNPIYFEGNLYFTSVLKDVPISGRQKRKAPSSLWVSRWQNNQFYAPKKVDFSFLSTINEVGDFSISADGRSYYITDWTMEGSKVVETTLWHFREGAGMKEVRFDNFPIIYDPVEWKQGNTTYLIFSAPGRKGDLDLYISEYSNQLFTTPKPLNKLNTSEDDKSPAVYENRLYFASKGLTSLGGFDLYYSENENGNWTTPVHLPYPINSTYDDDAITILQSTERMVVSSNRIGTESVFGSSCCNDLYHISENNLQIELDIETFNKETHKALSNTSIELFEMIDGRRLSVYHGQSDENGNATIYLAENREYEIEAHHEGYTPQMSNISTKYIHSNKKIATDLRLEPVGRGTVDQNEKPKYILPKFHFSGQSSRIEKADEMILDSLAAVLSKNKDIHIEVRVHSDGVLVNKKLTEKRAESIKSYLTKKGISSGRIASKGMGKEEPLFDCEEYDCTTVQRALNQRVEIVLTEGKAPRRMATIEEKNKDYPIITIENNDQDFGKIKKGETISGEFYFTNTGTAPLLIELATACVCTKLDWPLEEIPPGGKGVISFIYDSNLKEDVDFLDEVVVDIIANTKVIVTEAMFKVYVDNP